MTDETKKEASLELQDLVVILRIIDLASQRGAFKAAEMQDIGTAYNKVSAFLQSAAPKQETSEETPQETSDKD